MPKQESLPKSLPNLDASRSSITHVTIIPRDLEINGAPIDLTPGTVVKISGLNYLIVTRGNEGKFGIFEVGEFDDGRQLREAHKYYEPNTGVVNLFTATAPDGNLHIAVTKSLRPMVNSVPILELIRGYGEADKTAIQQAQDEARTELHDALGSTVNDSVLDRINPIPGLISTNTGMTPAYVGYFRLDFKPHEIDWNYDQDHQAWVGTIKKDLLSVDPNLVDLEIPEGANEEEIAKINRENKKRQSQREQLSGIEFLPPELIDTPDGFTQIGKGLLVGDIKRAAARAGEQVPESDKTQLLELVLNKCIPPHQRDFYRSLILKEETKGKKGRRLGKKLKRYTQYYNQRAQLTNEQTRLFGDYKTKLIINALNNPSAYQLAMIANELKRVSNSTADAEREFANRVRSSHDSSYLNPFFDPDKLTQREIDRAYDSTSHNLEVEQLINALLNNSLPNNTIPENGNIKDRILPAIRYLSAFLPELNQRNILNQGRVDRLIKATYAIEQAQALILAYDEKLNLVDEGIREGFISENQASKLRKRYKRKILGLLEQQISGYNHFVDVFIGNGEKIYLLDRQHRNILHPDAIIRIETKRDELIKPLIDRHNELDAELNPPKTRRTKHQAT